MRIALLVLLLVCIGGCAASNRPLQLISGAGPVYPAEARAQGIEGSVQVRYDVSVDGRVTGAEVISSSPPGVFDDAAVAAVRSWRFNAPVRDGQPVAATGLVSTVEFKLAGGSAYDGF